MNRPPLEVADVIRQCGRQFFESRGSSLTSADTYVLKCLAACRTAACGGHLEQCDHCGHQRPAYNSCGNRHCPKCQAAARAEWTDARQRDLLPVPYFHLVFTLPEQIARIALQNKKLLYNLLFKASAETLQQVASDPRHLGANIGFLGVLHTWGQNLQHHPHVHLLVPGGGLSPDESRWVDCRPRFFLPVRVLSHVFRAKFLDGMKRLYDTGQLAFHGSLSGYRAPSVFRKLLTTMYRKNWVVYAKPPFGGPAQVLKYLARYTHRVAISNHRLISLENGTVTFGWKNYAQGNQQQTMSLTGVEFLRRFLLHVLPKGFVRIRHFGLLANRHRQEKLALCRKLLNVDTTEVAGVCDDTHDQPVLAEAEQDNSSSCPLCQSGRMEIVNPVARLSVPELIKAPWPWDTS